MDRFEEVVNLKLDHIIEKVEQALVRVDDHEVRIRSIEKWKYKLAASGTAIAGVVGAAGHKLGEWLGFSSQ